MRKPIELAVATTLVLSGCTPDKETMPEPPEPTRDTSTMHAHFNAGGLPHRLPGEVMEQIPNSVSVHAEALQKTHGNGITELYETDLSGVRISTNTYLSAGHAVTTNSGKPIRNINQCSAVAVNTRSSKYTKYVYGKHDKRIYVDGQSQTVTRHVASFNLNDVDTGAPDITLLKAPDVRHTGRAYRMPTEIYNGKPLRAGTALFAINYEPTAKGSTRSPDQSELTGAERAAQLYKPAMLGGIVLQRLKNGNLEVITGMRSYGKTKDAHIRAGASGGPFYLGNGKLVGLTSRADNPESVKKLESRYGFDITGISNNTLVQTVVVQAVTKKLLARLRHRLAGAPACVPLK